MVTSRQERVIEEYMVLIKEAQREGANEYVIQELALQLYAYMYRQGLIADE